MIIAIPYTFTAIHLLKRLIKHIYVLVCGCGCVMSAASAANKKGLTKGGGGGGGVSEIYEEPNSSSDVWDSNYHNNNNSSDDNDDQSKTTYNNDAYGTERNGVENGRSELVGSFVLCLAHSGLIVLTFVILSIWLSYSLDECPSF